MTKLSCAEIIAKSHTVVFERQHQKFLFFERFAFFKDAESFSVLSNMRSVTKCTDVFFQAGVL